MTSIKKCSLCENKGKDFHGYPICDACKSNLKLFTDETIKKYLDKDPEGFAKEMDRRLDHVEKDYIKKKVKLIHIQERLKDLKTMKKIPPLYKTYFVDKDDTREHLFQILAEKYQPRIGLYPGSFVHITPSLFIENMTYVDNDRRISKFFSDPLVESYVNTQKTYKEKTKINCIQTDFTKDLPLEEDSFDIMFSFYSGFGSQYCKKYIKPNGILVANNSHGDSSLASADKDYQLIGVIKRTRDKFRLIETDLDTYFQKKDNTPVDTRKVLKRMIGESFTKTGYAYVFKKGG